MAYTVDTALVTAAKLALRVSGSTFDSEITDYLNAGLVDLGIAGVDVPDTMTPIVRTALITYTRLHFGAPEEYDKLKASYDEQKAQLSMTTGYTDWGDDD